MSNCKLTPPLITIATKVDAERISDMIVGTIVSVIDVENIIECDDTEIIIQDKIPLTTLVYIRPKTGDC